MKIWNKKKISGEKIRELSAKYGIDQITSSILLRRGITDGKDLLYYLEDDKRFLHNPFLFNSMEDAVDRILQAQEEGEIVLIFGDRDVDGISSTTILYERLKSMGIEVEWRLPNGNDGYGLSIEAVDDFYKKNGTLIITVDCGISNNLEIAHAQELGIDVIVLDHHNPPEKLPEGAIIVDPKCKDSGYPFQDISGAAVAYKTSLALRFTKSSLYKQEICLLCAKKDGKQATISALKVRNLVKQDFLEESFECGTVDFLKTKFHSFLSGQQIFVWNDAETAYILKDAFGSSIQFNLFDIQKEISKLIPQTKGMSLAKLKLSSKIARYNPECATEIESFFNIFVTYTNLLLSQNEKKDSIQEDKDLQLVALAALADIMPLKDENRILVKQGVKAINDGKTREGLVELMSKLKLLGQKMTSSKLSWNVVPVLNATGRLGVPELGMQLFLEGEANKRDKIAQQIIELNAERKQLGNEAWFIGEKKAEQSIEHFGKKLCVIIDEKINRGVSGILAGRLVATYNVPSMAITFVDDVAIGSMRSCRGFSIPPFLDKMSDLFINHGGHDFAAGFSFEKDKLEDFKRRLEELSNAIKLESEEEKTFEIDAELPPEYLNPEILNLVDTFEPYGEANPELTFLTQGLKIQDALTMGRPEPVHLKLILDAGKSKWPAVFFGGANLLHSEFEQGDKIDVLYQLQRNVFNGNTTPQMILSQTRKTLTQEE
ncbi:single-stranded-DNA-specific exonuclease RecJ [Treponema pectinovorum]|uniref:single-stranded-DNA-specific exonuclease RecJ n=1 Tax=Treponema pectinovorum TaxID=164 RepID=UPI0011F17135|nr:single-stranded-DNA-specific exonuclease RecJ [Treponema pectinovorum]